MSVSIRPLSPLHPAVASNGRPFRAEDLWNIPRLGAPKPSPDGNWAVVPVTTFDLEKNEARTRLWIVDARGSVPPRPLTAPELTSVSPAVSPDGTRVAFVRKRDKDDKAQLHVIPVAGGEAEKLTDLPLGVLDPRWFPDGRRIAFLAPLVAGHATPEATKKHLEEKAKDPVKAHATEDRIYRFWDRWLTGEEIPHIFVFDLETRELTDLTPRTSVWFDLMDPAGQYDVSPDGREIAFSASRSEPGYSFIRWGIYTVPTSGGEAICLTPDHPADDVRPRYSPDGRSIAYGMQRDPFFYADRVRLVRYDRTSGEHVDVTPSWDRSPSGWEFEPDGSLVLQVEDRGRVGIFRLPAAAFEGPVGGQPVSLLRDGSVDGVAPAGGRIFYARQTISEPPEIRVAAHDGSDERTLTRFTAPALDGIALGDVLEMEFEGAEGCSVQMFVVLPPGFDPERRWPLVHVIHGGPHAMSGDLFHPRWNAHLFAASGYVVALVNFHGSTSWGQEFTECIQGRWGDQPFVDIERATDYLLSLGFIDEKRMAVTGGSYGGYLVAWITSQTSRYACAVNHAGVSDLLAQYATDVTQGRHRSFGGEPWDGLEHIDRWNPLRFASGFQTPTLVVHGENDYRVPATQGLATYNVLRAKGVNARLLYFPDENHWVLKPKNSLRWYAEVHDWLGRYLARP